MKCWSNRLVKRTSLYNNANVSNMMFVDNEDFHFVLNNSDVVWYKITLICFCLQ